MLQAWVWEDGLFKLKARCPFGCGVWVASVGESLDILGLLEASRAALIAGLREELMEKTQFRCGDGGHVFMLTNAAIEQFSRELGERLESDEAWQRGIREFYGLFATIARRLDRG